MDLIERLRGMGAYASTFGRAEKLVASGSVLSCNVEAGAIASAVYLSGLVRSSHPGAGYRVRVSLDTAEGDVLDYSCECPVDGSGRGMCKHEMALALRYLAGAGEPDASREPGLGASAFYAPFATATGPLGHGSRWSSSQPSCAPRPLPMGRLTPRPGCSSCGFVAARPRMWSSVLPALEQVTALLAPPALRALVPPVPAFTFIIGLDDGLVTCRAFVSYGDARLGLYDPRRVGQPPRDLAAEYHAQDVVECYFQGVAGDLHFDESDDELLYRLLTDGLHDLGEGGEALLSECLRAIEVRDSPQVRVHATVKSGLLDVAVDSAGMSASDLAAYLASYKRRQRYVRLSSGDIVRIGDNLRTVDSLAEGLKVDVTELVGGVDGLLKKAEGVRLDRSAGFRAIVREFETFSDADIEMPPSLADVLRPYQVGEVPVRACGPSVSMASPARSISLPATPRPRREEVFRGWAAELRRRAECPLPTSPSRRPRPSGDGSWGSCGA